MPFNLHVTLNGASTNLFLSIHVISDCYTASPLQRNSSYKPPNCADLERLREQRIKELKMYSIIREICFYIVFLWTLMVVSYSNVDPLAFFMKDQYTKVLNNADGLNSFDKVGLFSSGHFAVFLTA